ncbi:MAG: PaaI family thioesterase [Syntrophomonadaceae bacterium]|jgi:acyl-CoA thioesterase
MIPLSVEELQEYVNQIPINQHFNVQVMEIGEGYAKTMTPFNPTLTNRWHNTHGGTFMTISDITFFLALSSLNGLDTSGNTSTVEIKTNFLSPNKDSELYAEARIIKNGRRNIFGDVSIKNSAGKVVAHSTVTYFKNR